MSYQVVNGDLIELAKQGRFDAIAHGCNCFCTMGAGVALAVATAFPEARAADAATVPGDLGKLGTLTRCAVEVQPGVIVDVVNCYTQYRYGRDRRHVDYQAVEQCLHALSVTYQGLRVGLPRIGANLGGGDWRIIEDLIQNVLAPVADVTVVLKD
jgi:O-acetyl-ADP-ribose deacetylase (regulator of RNase III)